MRMCITRKYDPYAMPVSARADCRHPHKVEGHDVPLEPERLHGLPEQKLHPALWLQNCQTKVPVQGQVADQNTIGHPNMGAHRWARRIPISLVQQRHVPPCSHTSQGDAIDGRAAGTAGLRNDASFA